MGRSILVTDSGLIARIDSRAVARRGLSFSLVPFFQSVVYTLLRSLDVGKSQTFPDRRRSSSVTKALLTIRTLN